MDLIQNEMNRRKNLPARREDVFTRIATSKKVSQRRRYREIKDIKAGTIKATRSTARFMLGLK